MAGEASAPMFHFWKKFFLWVLTVGFAGLTAGGYSAWREEGAEKWGDWNEERLLLLEVEFRLTRAIDFAEEYRRLPRKLDGSTLGDILDNVHDKYRRDYLVEPLRDRPVRSLLWGIIQLYKGEASQENIYKCREVIINQTEIDSDETNYKDSVIKKARFRNILNCTNKDRKREVIDKSMVVKKLSKDRDYIRELRKKVIWDRRPNPYWIARSSDMRIQEAGKP